MPSKRKGRHGATLEAFSLSEAGVASYVLMRSRTRRSLADMPDTFFVYDRGERIADLVIHVSGITLGAVAVSNLAIAAMAETPTLAFGLVIYGAGLLAMLICSALYNLTAPSPRKALLRRLDHAAIYIMIAGTYTPFALSLSPRAAGVALLVLVWIAAAAGVALKLAYPRRFETAACTGLVLPRRGRCFLRGADRYCGRIAARGRSSLHRWRRDPPLAQVALSQRPLARGRAGRRRLPLHSGVELNRSVSLALDRTFVRPATHYSGS